MNNEKDGAAELITRAIFAIPIMFVIVGVLLFLFQIFIYLYKGTWLEMSFCKLDNGCIAFDYWEKWIGIGKALKFTLSLHPFFSGLILTFIAVIVALIIVLPLIWIDSFIRDKFDK